LELVNGSAVLFRVTAPMPLTALEGIWAEKTFDFRFSRGCDCWFALAGIDLETRAGKYPLRLEGTGKGGGKVSFTSEVPVAEKSYPSTAISVAPRYVQPPPEAMARIQAEAALKKKLFSQILPETLWSGRFRPPVATPVTGVFGSARVLNGVKQSPHTGLDYHAAIGTRVRASNAGAILLARNLYYEGNCVIIDHGQGLLTFYMHLSRIEVKEGDKVASGQLLGLSGKTGRVTGPHLHFAVRWQGLYVDPATLIAILPPD
jgi:murein DD-endopeptidase MepM/ murein hydrolase activator NlpD